MAKTKKESGVQRMSPEIIKKVKELLNKNNNKLYCNSVARFIDIAVIELIEKIEKNGNKIRWGQND